MKIAMCTELYQQEIFAALKSISVPESTTTISFPMISLRHTA